MSSRSFLARLRLVTGLTVLAGMSLLTMAQSPSGWTTVSPGFSTEVLLSHEGAMWAAGSAESIAVSTDAGHHWLKKHENPDGALVLSFAFVNDKFGYAAGSGGVVVFILDGGETWVSRKLAPETILQAAFGDADHGIIRTRSALLATTNGGKDWKPVSPANDPDWSSKFPFIDGLTALDSSHLIARVSEGEKSDGEFLLTSDGGVTWKMDYLPNGAGSAKVFIAGGQYWSVGGEVVAKDKPGGGYWTPMAVRSSDGVTWEHLPVFHEVCHWHGCGGCTPQGCFAGQASFVSFSRILEDPHTNESNTGSGPSAAQLAGLDRFPPHLLSDNWATSGSTLCISTLGSVDCTSLAPVSNLDTRDESFDFDEASWPPVHPTPGDALSVSIESVLSHGLRCIRCNLLRSYFSEKGNSGPTPFGLSFVVGSSGKAEKIKLSGSLPNDVASKIRQVANSWLFEPAVENGNAKTVAVSLSGMIFVMNFSKPPPSR
jgi:hypothetical protein